MRRGNLTLTFFQEEASDCSEDDSDELFGRIGRITTSKRPNDGVNPACYNLVEIFWGENQPGCDDCADRRDWDGGLTSISPTSNYTQYLVDQNTALDDNGDSAEYNILWYEEGGCNDTQVNVQAQTFFNGCEALDEPFCGNADYPIRSFSLVFRNESQCDTFEQSSADRLGVRSLSGVVIGFAAGCCLLL